MAVDDANAAFWDELCGTTLARTLGITSHDRESLAVFDGAYLAFYPYLLRYLEWAVGGGKRVLEIGPGYGTVGRWLLAAGVDYHAVDIAEGPTAMARESLARAGRPAGNACHGSALDLPYSDGSFDAVVAVGSLHHTGNLRQAVSETHRVLRGGGRALVMVYNARSLNRLVTVPAARAAAVALPSRRDWILARTDRDRSTAGVGAPHTDYLTTDEARACFSAFSTVSVERQGASPLTVFGRTVLSAAAMGRLVGRVAGLDLYVRAVR